MNRLLLLLGVLLLGLSSCRPSPVATTTPTLTPSQTALPPVVLTQGASLFSGPGSLSFQTLAELPVGASVHPAGLFVDFVQASVVVSGNEVTGFIRKDALQYVPEGLPVLETLEVPWEPMYLPSCAPGEYDPQSDSVTFSTREGEEWFGTESAAWTLETPVRVQLARLSFEGRGIGDISLMGVTPGSVSPDIWWQGVRAMGIRSLNGEYQLAFMDGTTENAKATINLNRSISLPIQILFDQPEGRGFSVLDENGKVLQHIDVTSLPRVSFPDGLFPERKFYFGISVNAQSSMTVTGLSIGTAPSGAWIEPVTAGPGLAALAEAKGVAIGTEFQLRRMIDRRYCQVMQRDYNLITVTEFSFPTFWRGPGQYDFNTIDRYVEFAEQHGWRVYGSHLVWGEATSLPDWLRTGQYTREEYLNILEEHIHTVVGRYRDRVQQWGIANEASDRQYWKSIGLPPATVHDFWYEAIGPEYIELSFRWAHEADPDAILVFNGGYNAPPFDRHSRAIFELAYSTVRDLKAKGIPIDGVGMQMHLFWPGANQTPPQKQELIETMQSYAGLGVRIYITELEVDLGSRLGAATEHYAFQAQVYRDIIAACIESEVCGGFYTWGVSDALSWVVCSHPYPICLREPNGDPLLFDRAFHPKPAYFAVSDALTGAPFVPTPTAAVTATPVTPFVSPAPSPDSLAAQDLYDHFDDPAHENAFDTRRWNLSGNSPSPKAHQHGGSLVLEDYSDELGGGDVNVVARGYDGILLSEPLYVEAAMALSADSAPGSIAIKITATDAAVGSLLVGCGITRYSSQFRSGCSEIVWPPQEGHSYATPEQEIAPGSWHTFRIELDPASMTMTYSIDGAVVGSHVLVDGEALRDAPFQFSLGTWKASVLAPLTGAVSYVSIGQVQK